MDFYPSIDLLGGRTVRLSRGDYELETVYDADPVDVARRFAAAGAAWIHMVDLDAARTGVPANRDVIAAVAAAVDVPVQAGGGVRDAEAAAALLSAGVSRVVVGTAAVEHPELVAELVAAHPGRVAVGLDHREGANGRREVAVRGWTEGSGVDLRDAIEALEGVAAVIVTEIERDGMLSGPGLAGLADVLSWTPVDVIASGGVSGAADIAALGRLEAAGRRLSGVIVGRALYEGKLTPEEAVAACAR